MWPLAFCLEKKQMNLTPEEMAAFKKVMAQMKGGIRQAMGSRMKPKEEMPPSDMEADELVAGAEGVEEEAKSEESDMSPEEIAELERMYAEMKE